MGFIDDVMKNINQGINDIQNKSQDVMQTVSINARIRSLEERKQQLLVNIGQLVYDKYEKGDEVSEDLLREKVKELAGLERNQLEKRSFSEHRSYFQWFLLPALLLILMLTIVNYKYDVV